MVRFICRDAAPVAGRVTSAEARGAPEEVPGAVEAALGMSEDATGMLLSYNRYQQRPSMRSAPRASGPHGIAASYPAASSRNRNLGDQRFVPHPVIMRQLAADHIREMHAKAEHERLAHQARRARRRAPSTRRRQSVIGQVAAVTRSASTGSRWPSASCCCSAAAPGTCSAVACSSPGWCCSRPPCWPAASPPRRAWLLSARAVQGIGGARSDHPHPARGPHRHRRRPRAAVQRRAGNGASQFLAAAHPRGASSDSLAGRRNDNWRSGQHRRDISCRDCLGLR